VTTQAPSLTEADRRAVAQALELAAVSGAGAVREHTGETDIGMAYACAFGEARHLLTELAAIAERLGGGR